jgi:hypothetical protein
MATLFQELIAAGCEIDNHESDLFVKDSPISRSIIKRYSDSSAAKATLFRSTSDNEMWWDIPFAYDPFWEKNGIR